MNAEQQNPFDLVKASDLTDAQIADYFVDFPGGASLIQRIKPTSAMPMIIFGGKGSGKTHLMRYLSYQLVQQMAGGRERAMAAVSERGYVGVYFRCGGLNAQRFAGKGQDADAWTTVFSYYMELWFGQLVLKAITDLCPEIEARQEASFVAAALELFDLKPQQAVASIVEFRSLVAERQRTADVAINNSALTRQLSVDVDVSPGRMTFGLPRAATTTISAFSGLRFLYLLDEFENLAESQQQYINTLLREREDPCSFKVGVRLYGLRTKSTLSASEENREDSEYEALRLDSELRERPLPVQLAFAGALVRNRLVKSGYLTRPSDDFDPAAAFERGDDTRLLTQEGELIARKYAGREIPYIVTLRSKLTQGLRVRASPGLKSPQDVERVLSTLRCPDHPFVERTSVFLFYRAWSKKSDLLKAAEEIAASAADFIAERAESEHLRVLKYFRSDILAQMLQDTGQRQQYLGFETFVQMSSGLPRGLLTILKYVFTWALFLGETPFRGTPISRRAQAEGVTQAAEWFFTEARSPGRVGPVVRDGMTRLGELLRELRFSDKPSECSLSTFSANLSGLEGRDSEAIIRDAENWSMLVRVPGGQHDRNASGRVDEKFQVHPMLAPRWDLPIARRGAIALAADEAAAVFDPQTADDFKEVKKRRLDAMTAPRFGAKAARAHGTPVLPGFDDG